MLGLKRRKRIEGWALDISDTESSSFIKKIGESNKIWLGCFIAVILLGLVFIKTSGQFNKTVNSIEPPDAPSTYRNQERYLQFSSKFVHDKRFAEVVDSAEFLEPGQFRVIVPSTTSADEIDYIAKMAAEMIKHKFNHKVLVHVYIRSPKQRLGKLAATALWSPNKDKQGFIVKQNNGEEDD